VGIVVNNMENSLKFYQDLLGFKIIRDMDEHGIYINNMLSLDNVQVRTVKLSAGTGNTLIELLDFKSHDDNDIRNFYTIGASHVALTVDNLEDLYKHLTKNNVKFNAPPQKSPDGLVKVTFCNDPDGTPIELVEILDSIETKTDDKNG
jgi:catechol 2,3-dioxygenase-like lactoylglutathione lyase family enzyme|tara:strand:- start:269 stop:712 length:444 start_codon:yes stop_codon:yes gene_type:complete